MAKLLVVDDELPSRRMAVAALSTTGHTVEQAASFAEAKQKLSAAAANGHPFHVVLGDAYQSMAGAVAQPMGLELAEWMKDNTPSTKMVLTSGFPEHHFSNKPEYQDLRVQQVITHFVEKTQDLKFLKQAVKESVASAIASLAAIQPPSSPGNPPKSGGAAL